MAALNYGWVQHPKPGQRVSGDAWLVLEREEGILIALVDGLGSGEPAREAAERAVQCLRQATEWEVSRLLEACHEALIPSRGAAMALLLIEPRPAHLAGVIVGNVEVRASQSSRIQPIPAHGIVGAHYHPLRPFSCHYTRGELVAVHTDGLSHAFDFDLEIARVGPRPQDLARHLAHHFGRPTDDVTVLVAELP
jgi:negative regulator of sigma-B (phosphoserine phosphatase)